MSLTVSITIKTDSRCTQMVFTLWSQVRISPYTHHVPWQLYPGNPFELGINVGGVLELSGSQL